MRSPLEDRSLDGIISIQAYPAYTYWSAHGAFLLLAEVLPFSEMWLTECQATRISLDYLREDLTY